MATFLLTTKPGPAPAQRRAPIMPPREHVVGPYSLLTPMKLNSRPYASRGGDKPRTRTNQFA